MKACSVIQNLWWIILYYI